MRTPNTPYRKEIPTMKILWSSLAVLLLAVGVAHTLTTHADASTDDASAATRTFTIENMTCAACPITVRKAMSNVDGVTRVDVDFETKTATVAFDPSVTDVETIAAASIRVGYPATVQTSNK